MSRWSTKNANSTLKYLITPLLFSVYPVIFLYTHNIELLTLGQLQGPLLIAILLAALTFIVWKLILNENIKASLAAIGVLVLFWNYALLFSGINDFFKLNHWHVLPLLLFIYGNLVYLICILSKRFDFDNLHKIVLAVVSVLIIFNLINMIPEEIKKYQITAQKEVHQEIGKKTVSKNYPDIYLIILDEYASLDTIKEEWGYNNSTFGQFLKDKGFYVTEKSEHRYLRTTMSVPSLLNVEYMTPSFSKNDILSFLFQKKKPKGTSSFEELKKISSTDQINKWNNNYLINFLKLKNYRITTLEGISQHYPTFALKNIDFLFSYQDAIESKFNASLSGPFYKLLIEKSIISVFDWINIANKLHNINYYGTKAIINYLKTETKQDGPEFVYAHIMCPHNPYIFDRDGNYVSYNFEIKKEEDYNYMLPNEELNKAYLEQYIYITNEIKNVVNHKFNNGNPTNKIIIIQNDHGPRPHELYLKDKTQSFKAFNAVYFPDGDYADLYENIAPINTLRVILNKYFGEEFEMLEDR